MGVSAADRAAFLDGADPAARRALEAAADLDARLGRVLATARAAWPALAVADADFLAFVARRVTTPDALDRLFSADLYLACAWLQGDPAAAAALEEGPFRDAAQLLGRFNAPAHVVEEAKQSTRSILFARDAGHPALAGYTGRGPLRAWLGIMLSRELLQLFRKDKRLARLETGELVQLVDKDADPETVYLKNLYGEQFRGAFNDALRGLDAGDKRLLRYTIVERLTIDDVSALTGVHRATAARRIAAARARLLDVARRLMKERLRVDSGELQSLLGLCEGELDASVLRLLGEGETSA